MNRPGILSASALAALLNFSMPAGVALAAVPQANSAPAPLKVVEMRLSRNELTEADFKTLAVYLKEHPADADAHLLAGKIYDQQGLNDLAQDEYHTAEKLAPQRPQSVLEAFAGKLESNDLKGALQDFDYLSLRFPRDPSVLLMWSMILSARGEDKGAEQLLQKAIAAAPERIGVASGAGALRLAQNRNREALDLASRDLKADPEYYTANAVAGQACLRLRQHREGGNYLRKAFALRPLEKENDRAFAAAFLQSGMYGDALEPALVYMTECSAASDMQSAKATVLQVMRNLPVSECENVARMVDTLFEKRSDLRARFHLAVADVYDRRGWRAAAKLHYAIGITLEPTNPRGYFRLGRDEQREGRFVPAALLFLKAHNLNGEDRQITMALARSMERERNRGNDLARAIKESYNNVVSSRARLCKGKPDAQR